MPSEFELIDRYFKRPTRHTVLGVGDDGAIVRPRAGMELVVSTDMLVSGTHFLASAEPRDLGWKALAVNVSDMAAMGAEPRWALLAAALPAATESWIAAFAEGFFGCADAFDIDVIGGDTTKGPRNFCVTIMGEVPEGRALRRSGAAPGDEIWISGTPGLAALGLAHVKGHAALADPALTECLAALHRPQPRVALGLALRGIASAAIDVSDGLLADLGHILDQSQVAAAVENARLPDAALKTGVDATLAHDCLLSGGDDYELLFTAPPARRADIEAIAARLPLALTRIGSIERGTPGGLRLIDAQGQPLPVGRRGFDHFG